MDTVVHVLSPANGLRCRPIHRSRNPPTGHRYCLNRVEALEQTDAVDVLGLRVAAPAFGPKTQRRAVGHRQPLSIEYIRKNRLWVMRRDQGRALDSRPSAPRETTAVHRAAGSRSRRPGACSRAGRCRRFMPIRPTKPGATYSRWWALATARRSAAAMRSSCNEADTEISMARMRQGRSISRSRVVAGLDALLFLAALSPRRFALLTHRF